MSEDQEPYIAEGSEGARKPMNEKQEELCPGCGQLRSWWLNVALKPDYSVSTQISEYPTEECPDGHRLSFTIGVQTFGISSGPDAVFETKRDARWTKRQLDIAFAQLLFDNRAQLSDAKKRIRVLEAERDARISSLEQTVAKAFLALGEVAEALEPLTCRSTPEHEADDAECEIDVTTGDLRKAKAVRERIMDLCHATDPRADSPHRADGALQSDDGEQTQI